MANDEIVKNYETFHDDGSVPVKSWTRGVPFEAAAKQQLVHIAALPFIHKWVAVMPDVHLGKGATIGSVIPSLGAIIPAAVGVDIGCGMMAVQTTLKAADLPDNLHALRSAIEAAIPHGRTVGHGKRDKGAWHDVPKAQAAAWKHLRPGFDTIVASHKAISKSNHVQHLGTLGTGNHFIEMCIDENDQVWLMLHSGSRGVGNKIGTYFIELAKQDMRKLQVNLPDQDLAYLKDGTQYFADYVFAVHWAQEFARTNRMLMMDALIAALRTKGKLPAFEANVMAVNCHHNYVAREHHYGEDVWLTRKGAVSARKGELGIIPGSMGARSFIVRGLGNAESFESCSHGAGRVMSRMEAKRRVSLDEHIAATTGVECRKDIDVIDETPSAYKSIDAVMHAQRDLVEVVHTLKQLVCVKG